MPHFVPKGQELESADQQVAMLRALLNAAKADEEGMVMIQRDHFLDALAKIEEDHCRQLAAMSVIAERLMSCFGVTA